MVQSVNISQEEIAWEEREPELVPQAIVGRSLAQLAERLEMRLHESHDDLDAYEGLDLRLDHHMRFAVRHYSGHPADTATIYLPRDIGNLEEVTHTIERITAAIGVAGNEVIWQRRDDPDL